MEGHIPALTGTGPYWRRIALLFAALVLFRATVTDWNHVPSGSMLPALLIGDRIVVDKLAYGLRIPFTPWWYAQWRGPARGDVVTFDSPEDGRLMVKRVVGLPGDLVAMSDSRLSINGTTADYQPLPGSDAPPAGDGAPVDAPCSTTGFACYRERVSGREWLIRLRRDGITSAARDFTPVRVPDGQYLLLGDNRDHSHDSREIGFVARERIVGRATRVAFSLDGANHNLPRTERFLNALH